MEQKKEAVYLINDERYLRPMSSLGQQISQISF